jgi:hypothetical protein
LNEDGEQIDANIELDKDKLLRPVQGEMMKRIRGAVKWS